ncbi:hypothetical protein BGC07_15895 [Piscirickettsia litoralis]|uniref:Uncharacterized protein n=1 Tax=Piscirickettsia litoralis TaxID=1891921 RepID=A0ABX2ZY87_9GAMM|nr:hypothetical protein BGC07_15895 [Piscirickettsia litoralis]
MGQICRLFKLTQYWTKPQMQRLITKCVLYKDLSIQEAKESLLGHDTTARQLTNPDTFYPFRLFTGQFSTNKLRGINDLVRDLSHGCRKIQ